jgi:Family of unknown function (DUF5678)
MGGTVTTAELGRQLNEQRKLAENLANYTGEWVAVRGAEVVAHSKTLDELRELLTDIAVDGIQRVPDEATSGAFF